MEGSGTGGGIIDKRTELARKTIERLKRFARRLQVANGRIEATGYRVTEVKVDSDGTVTRRVLSDGKGETN